MGDCMSEKKRLRGARGGNPWRASQVARFDRGEASAITCATIGSSLRENLHPILLAVLFPQKDRLLKLLKDHLLEHLSLVLGVGFGSLIDQTFETEINLRIARSAKV